MTDQAPELLTGFPYPETELAFLEFLDSHWRLWRLHVGLTRWHDLRKAFIAGATRPTPSERPVAQAREALEPVRKYADTFSAVSVIKEMFFPAARSNREAIAEAIYFSQRGRLVDQGGVTAQRPWRDNSIPDTFWNHFLADADAVLALNALTSERPSESAVACDTAAFQNTDNADATAVLAAVRHCANSWDGSARLLGNVRAVDIARACSTALVSLSIPHGDAVRVQATSVASEKEEEK